jgi:hypothetical protein
MHQKATSKDAMRDFENRFSNIIHCEPTVQIGLKGAQPGQYRVDRINKDCWRDEVFCRGYELYWAEKGFEVVGELSHAVREAIGLSKSEFRIDPKSGKVPDFASREFAVKQQRVGNSLHGRPHPVSVDQPIYSSP